MQRYDHDPKKHQRAKSYMVKTCAICGQDFEKPSNWRKTDKCPACAQAASQQRTADRKESRRLVEEAGIPRVCQRCGEIETESRPLTLHHKHPLSMGGGPELENVEFICSDCHSKAHRGLLSVGAWEGPGDS